MIDIIYQRDFSFEQLEPENISEFNFTFGRLYSKPDYPYQSVVEAFYDIQPKSR